MTRIVILVIISLTLLKICLGLATIEPLLLKEGRHNSDADPNIFITMKDRTKSVLQSVSSMSFRNKGDQVSSLIVNLKSHAKTSQQSILNLIRSKRSFSSNDIRSFWITNQIYIKNADIDLIKLLSTREDIVKIEKEKIVRIDEPIDLKLSDGIQSLQEFQEIYEWNIELIEAPEVWANDVNGSGIVVANIDTGVRFSHEALRTNYKNDSFSWFDPYTFSTSPYDDNGHGTHTMGTVCGAGGIGVAPGAKWISCKGFGPDGLGYQAEMLSCGQFMLCPTFTDGSSEDCTQRPNIVSNSWNSREQTADWFNDVIDAWHEANIIPVFSNSNYGTSCCSLGSQAARKVIAVGATNVDDQLAWFSSVGPSYLNEVKPDISAPGERVRSSYHLHDASYGIASGTSMACPHTAGLAALLLSADSTLKYDDIKAVIQETAERNLTFTGEICGGVRDDEFPNNQFGHGRLSALSAYNCVIDETGLCTSGETSGSIIISSNCLGLFLIFIARLIGIQFLTILN